MSILLVWRDMLINQLPSSIIIYYLDFYLPFEPIPDSNTCREDCGYLFSGPLSKIVTRLKWRLWVTPALWRHQNPWQDKDASPCIIYMSVRPHKCRNCSPVVDSVPKRRFYWLYLVASSFHACKDNIRRCNGQTSTSIPRSCVNPSNRPRGKEPALKELDWSKKCLESVQISVVKWVSLPTNRCSLWLWETEKYMECVGVATSILGMNQDPYLPSRISAHLPGVLDFLVS